MRLFTGKFSSFASGSDDQVIRWVILHKSQTDGDHSIAAVWGDTPFTTSIMRYFRGKRTSIGSSSREADGPSDSSIVCLWIWTQLQMSDFSLNTIMMWGMSGLNEFSQIWSVLCVCVLLTSSVLLSCSCKALCSSSTCEVSSDICCWLNLTDTDNTSFTRRSVRYQCQKMKAISLL